MHSINKLKTILLIEIANQLIILATTALEFFQISINIIRRQFHSLGKEKLVSREEFIVITIQGT